MFNPSRDQVRQFFIEAWRKHRERAPTAPLETIAAELVDMHPEYHALLETDDALTREWQNPDMPYKVLAGPKAGQLEDLRLRVWHVAV